MADSTPTTRFRFWLWLIRVIGVIVPRHMRADWRQEWEAELRYRETLLAEWDRLDWRAKLDLVRRSFGAFRDALLLQPQRMEDEMFQDVRFGIRMLLKQPVFTCITIITLALGIGANTAIFSVVNAALLKPLPYDDPDKLVMVYGGFLVSGDMNMPASVPEFTDYREQSESFESLGAYGALSANLAPGDGGEPERVEGGLVTPEIFSVLKTSPLKGRLFLPEEAQEGRDAIVLLGYGLWQRRFGGDDGIVGRQIMVNGRNQTVVGVMPPGFAFPQQIELWRPLWFPRDQYDQQRRGARGLSVVARLKPAVTLAQAKAEMDRLAAQQAEQYPRNYRERGWKISLVPLLDDFVGTLRPALLLLFGAVSFVLLIGCANVANLLLARATTRRHEIAVRLAIGAGRGRIVRQLLTESTVLGMAGGVAGLLFAWWGVRLLLRSVPDSVPRVGETSVDAHVLAFTCMVSLVTGLVFGLIPALAASRPDLNDALKEGGRGGSFGAKHRMRSSLVVSEIALALVLLIGAGLTLKSFWRLLEVDPGFNPDGVVTMRLLLPTETYPQPAQRVAFFQRTLEDIRTLPGVETVSAASLIPMMPGGFSGSVSGENSAVGPADIPVETEMRWVTPDHFKTVGIEILDGRAFTEADSAGAQRVATIDESFARRFYPNESPIGKRIKRGRLDSANPWLTVVGVVRHVRNQSLDVASRVQAYFPFYQDPLSFNMSLAVRTAGPDAGSLAGAVRRAIQQIDPNQPVYSVRTLRDVVTGSVAPRRLVMLLMGVFAAVALALASVGIFGVMSYFVTQRTHEWGIRLALGAQRGDVLKRVLGRGMVLTSSGVLIGLAAAWTLLRLVGRVLASYTMSEADISTFLGATALLIFVALMACWIPARRATGVDPIAALRQE